MPGGLSGLAFLPQGFSTGGQQFENMLAMQNANLGDEALGRMLQSLGMSGAGGPSMPGPSIAPGIPPIAFSGAAGAPGASSPPGPAGVPVPGGPAPAGPTPPPAAAGGGPMPGGGGGGAMPPPGTTPLGTPAQGGFGLPYGQMAWQELARRIVQANPGARPEVIAAAVTKALPLMNAQSQADWRMIQLQLAEERIQNMRQRAVETEQYHQGLTTARMEGIRQRDESLALARQRLDQQAQRDTKANELKQAALNLRQQALGASISEKDRKAVEDSWYKAQRAYDAYMRSRVSAASNIPDKEQRDAMLKALDEEWNEFLRERDAFNRGEIGGLGAPPPAAPAPPPAKPGLFGGTPAPPTSKPLSAPAAPLQDDMLRRRGQSMLKSGQGTPTGAPGAGGGFRQMSPQSIAEAKAYIQANPGEREALIQNLTRQGFVVPDGL